MTIWAFNPSPDDATVSFVTNSIKEGISRFGWSYSDSANLILLKEKSWNDMGDSERDIWKKSNFLLEISEDDWIVHINVPTWGKCTAGKVNNPYHFDPNNKLDDFRHCIDLDIGSIIEFDRNDDNIVPIVSRSLKLRGRYWKVYCKKEFFESVENLKTNKVNTKGENRGTFFLKKHLSEPLEKITELIHKNHAGKKLEGFLAKVFRNIPTVKDVKENGVGWGTDYGADLIVEYNSGLPINGLEITEKLVVQVKSYEGEHWETNAVEQIEMAVQEFDADAGMLITTATKTERLEQAIDKLSNKSGKPIALLAGIDVARFVMKFYGDELLSMS